MYTSTKAPYCWIETSVRCRGGKNMDGFYVLGQYATLDAGRAAMADHIAKNPKAFALLSFIPGCPES